MVAFASSMATHPWGGSEELWSQAAITLANDGHRVAASVVKWTPHAVGVSRMIAAGVAVSERRDRGWIRVQTLARRTIGQSPSAISARTHEAWLRRVGAGLVCVSNAMAWDALPWMEACRRTGRPYVVIAQANAEYAWPADELAGRVRDAYVGARACFFVSNRNRELLEDQIAAGLENAEVVRNPFNVPFDSSIPWPNTIHGWNIACVGRLEPGAKGQDVLLNVLAMSKWRNRPLQVTFYGAGACSESVRRLCNRLELKRVKFAGHVLPVEKIWKENHALILPSRYEGLPLALVEAMLCGRPAIVSDVAGMTELVKDGRTGFVAPAPTVAILDQALERAWSLRESWSEMGKYAAYCARAAVPANPAKAFADRLMAFIA